MLWENYEFNCANKYKSDAAKGIIINFTNEYINYLNKDIFKTIDYFKKKGMQPEFNKLHAMINGVFSNISEYLTEIIDNNVTKITRLGDMHGNKCTILIEHRKNKLIYKPIRSHFLTLINKILLLFNQSDEFSFYILQKLSENSKGSQIEFIEDEESFDTDKFSYHYGAIILILTLLRGTDFHAENIFTVCSTPVIIDYETLFYPQIYEFKDYDVTATGIKNYSSIIMKYELEDLMDFNIPSFYFEGGNLFSSKKKLIKQNIILSSVDRIYTEMNNLEQLKNNILNVMETL
jgi:lantibiotic modifying enzyme